MTKRKSDKRFGLSLDIERLKYTFADHLIILPQLSGHSCAALCSLSIIRRHEQ